jgi:two-component system, OmpR family, heavy metal sensor histidine kinase CusS
VTAAAPPAASLGRQLSWRFALLSLSALVVASLLVYASLAWTLANRQHSEMQQKRSAIEHTASELGSASPAEMRHRFDDFLAGHEDLGLVIHDAAGATVYAGGITTTTTPLAAMAFALPLPPPSGQQLSARLAIDTRGDDRVLRVLAATLGAIALAGAAIVSYAGTRLVRRGLAPVSTLSRQVEELALDQRGLRLDGSAQPPELQPLVASFNRLLVRAELAYGQLEAFNADVAHELRTPLTSLIGISELALTRVRNEAELIDVIALNLEDLRRLSGIVDDMLFLSQADRGRRARRAPVPSVSALFEEILDFHGAVLQEACLAARIEGDAAAQVDAGLLRRALSNLLSNASRFAERGSTVVVAVSTPLPGRLRLAVHNHGPTITAPDLPRLFDRFFRVDAARPRSGTHFGLGLAIVAAIARMHDGEAFARSSGGETIVGVDIASAATLTSCEGADSAATQPPVAGAARPGAAPSSTASGRRDSST